MNSRIWRSSALAGSITLVVLLSTQGAAGQPPARASNAVSIVPQANVLLNANSVASPTASTLPAIPESASLLLLGSAFAIAARQLRRVII